MASTPTLALNSDGGATSVVLPGFESRHPTIQEDVSFVRYAGDQPPRVYRGEGRATVWTLSGNFSRSAADQVLAGELLDLLESAYGAADGRLRLTPGGNMDAFYPTYILVSPMGSYTPAFQPNASGILNITISLQEVL